MKLHHLREYVTLEKNINVQVQKNSSNIAGGQSGAGNMYSDSPIFQGKSTEQDSQITS